MKTTTKLLGMTAAVAILSTPALAGKTIKTQVGEKVTYETKAYAEAGDDVVGYEIVAEQEFSRLDANSDGSISRKEFYNKTMLNEEAEIFALFDSNQSNDISPEEFSKNSRYGNAKLTNKTTSNIKSGTNGNFSSLRTKYYDPAEKELYLLEPSAGESTAIEADIDYKGDIKTPSKVKTENSYN